MMTSSPKRILCIGASKHIGYHILEDLAPQPDKYQLFVLARTPADKIAPFPGKENVNFIQGDGKDEDTVRRVLTSDMESRADFVVITVGGTIVYNKFFMPRFSDLTLCGTVAQVVVNVCRSLPSPPVIIGLSSTGILSTHNLLPWSLKPLYRTMLHKPHADKIAMENAITSYPHEWIIIRGALYTDGKKTGKYRVGETEVGYTISRRDVADFIEKECIDGDGKWLGKRPVIVY